MKKSNKVTLSGIIKSTYLGGYHKIKLIQPDGYEIDLVSRFLEIYENYSGNMQVSYYITDEPCTKNKLLEKYLNQKYGSLDADYSKEEVHYSSWTSDMNYTTTLSIGGHDLFNELMCSVDKYLILEINFTK